MFFRRLRLRKFPIQIARANIIYRHVHTVFVVSRVRLPAVSICVSCITLVFFLPAKTNNAGSVRTDCRLSGFSVFELDPPKCAPTPSKYTQNVTRAKENVPIGLPACAQCRYYSTMDVQKVRLLGRTNLLSKSASLTCSEVPKTFLLNLANRQFKYVFIIS